METYLQQRMEELGGAAEKHTNPGHRGDPDRLCTMPHWAPFFVETKWAEDAEPETHQLRRHIWWRKRGIEVYVLRSKRQVDEFMKRFE